MKAFKWNHVKCTIHLNLKSRGGGAMIHIENKSIYVYCDGAAGRRKMELLRFGSIQSHFNCELLTW